MKKIGCFISIAIILSLSRLLYAGCPNLVIDGDFENASCPPVTFQSTMNCGSIYPGNYHISTDASKLNRDWHGLDHTNPGTGKFYIGDGPSNLFADAKVWYQSIQVSANMQYTFSAWVCNIDVTDYTPDPILNLSINGAIVATSGPIPEYTPWREMKGQWTAPADMTVEIAVIITGGRYGGNDFGVDDISFTGNYTPTIPPAQNLSQCGSGALTLHLTDSPSYRWYAYDTSKSPVHTGSSLHIPLISQDTLFYVSSLERDGCESEKAPVQVSVLPLPLLDLGPDVAICEGTTHTFGAPPGYEAYFWNSDHSDSLSTALTTGQKGKYWLTVRHQNQCIATDTAEITTVYPLPVLKVSKDTTVCAGSSVQLFVSGAAYHHWSPGPFEGSTIIVTPQTTTTYTVKSQDTHRCGYATKEITVHVYPTPAAPVFPSTYTEHCFDEEGPFTIEAGYGKSFYWENRTDTTQSIVTEQAGIYPVTVSDEYGCSSSAHMEVENYCPPRLFIPSAFTPNQDGLNDQLTVAGKHFKNFELKIFNRWGEIIFISNDPSLSWDGTYLGKEMPIGTYPWIIRYENISRLHPVRRSMEGSVTLLR